MPRDAELSRELEQARSDPRRAFGPFLLLSELGKGGMGVVYRAWDERLGRVVALKKVRVEGDQASDVLARFQREAAAVARLRHPNIVSVHEAGQLAGEPYLTMDFIEGATLDRRLAGPGPTSRGGARLPLTRAIEVVRDIALAVHYAHEQGVIHRDLKPQNVILDAQDRPYVLDFGLAKMRELEDRTRLTKTGATLGTPAYMPPEQASGEADESSDVYSLGAILYHVLTGRPPFLGSMDYNVLLAVLTRDPDPPAKLNPRAAGDLETICLKCLEKEPKKRYASARGLALDLERHLAGEPIVARPLGRLGHARRWVRRNRLLSLALAAVLIAASASLAFFIEARTRSQREARASVLAAARSEADETWAAFEVARKSRQGDESVALGFEAFQAASRLSSLEPDDASARDRAFRAACALGDAALSANQWSVAARAFERASKLHVDDALASKGLERVRTERSRIETEHREAIARVISAVHTDRIADFPGGRTGALFTLVRLAEPQTVSILSKELDRVSDRLRPVTRELYASSGVQGARVAATNWFATAPVDAVDAATNETLLEARHALEHEEESMRAGTQVRARTFSEIAGERQKTVLGENELELAKLAAEALGWIGLPEAIDPLARYLCSDEDQMRTIAAAEALCRLASGEHADPRAAKIVEQHASRVSPTAWERLLRTYRGTQASGQDEPRTAWEYLARALQRLPRHDAEGARKDTSRAIELDPSLAGPWAVRAAARRELGDREGAMADVDRAIQLDPRDAEAYMCRGNLKLDAGDLDGALADFERTAELSPGVARSWTNLGMARREKHDLAGAKAAFTRAVDLEPNVARVWTDRGIVRSDVGDQEGAIQDLDHAIEIDGTDPRPWNARAVCRIALGEIDRALADVTKAIELAPREPHYRGVRGTLLMNKGDLDGAIDDFSRGLDAGAKEKNLWISRGLARGMKNDLDGAVADLSRAIELDPRNPLAWLNRGIAKQRKGDLDGARVDLERYLELDPHGPQESDIRRLLAQLKGR